MNKSILWKGGYLDVELGYHFSRDCADRRIARP